MAASLSIRILKQHRQLQRLPPVRRNASPAAPLSSLASFHSSPPQLPNPQVEKRGALSKLLLFLPGTITFGLGTWQLFRRQEKIEMLDYRRRRLEMEPLMCSELTSVGNDLGSLEFRRVVCEGDFDESKSVFIGPRSRSISGVTENGYYVITPLIPRATGAGSLQQPILVNRGWVPRSWRNKPLENSVSAEIPSSPETDSKQNDRNAWWKFWPKTPKSPELAGQSAKEQTLASTRVIGVIRGSEKPSIFVPENDPSSGQWFYVDVPMIARACGLPENTLYLEDINDDIDASNPYPVPKDVNTLIYHSVMPHDHVKYMMTWYTLSAAVTYMAIRRIKPKKIHR